MHVDIAKYSRIVVLTGAGVSVASGLRAFRGPGGIWDEHDVARYGHVDALRAQPADTWNLFGRMRKPVLAARPNAAHLALASLEASLRPDQQFLLVTQNVDGLHQLAGSRHVCEIHGNIMFSRCSSPSCTLERFRDEEVHSVRVPECSICGSVLRPDIVLFGEELPALQSWTAKRALRDCDLFMAVGTSGTVAPASTYVRSAAYAGARTIYVNREPMSEPNPAFQEQYTGLAEDLLPAFLGLDVKA